MDDTVIKYLSHPAIENRCWFGVIYKNHLQAGKSLVTQSIKSQVMGLMAEILLGIVSH